MVSRLWLSLAMAVAFVGPATAQDVQTVLRTAAETLGVTDMESIRYSGIGWQGRVGQNVAPAQDWPRVELTSYTRTIDFESMSSREEFVREGGDAPTTNLVSGAFAWSVNAAGRTIPQPAAAELRQIEILLTPWGFLKGAMAPGADPVLIARNEYGGRVSVVSFVALGKYRVNGTIDSEGIVHRVQTWVPNPVVGDLYYENVLTPYREVGGIMFPRFHQHQDYDDGANEPNVSGGDHSFGLETVTAVQVNVANAAPTVPDGVRSARVQAVRVESRQLGDGLWLIAGGSHHSVAIEFGDHVAVIEAPQNEARSLAVIDEVHRLTDKPIRFIVTTHHHWDHLGGLRTYAHEGATVVTHEGNHPYYQEILRAGPWMLEPDRYSLHPPEEWSEGYIFETVRQKYVLADATRTVELHAVQGLAHAAGMLIAYLPDERMVVQADLYNPGGQAPNASNRTFYRNLQRLGLDVETIVGIHGNPVSMAEFAGFVSGGP